MKSAAHVVLTLTRLTGMILIILGVIFWTGHALQWIPGHIVIGSAFVLLLWAQAGLAARLKIGAGMVAFEIGWGILVLVLGMVQGRLLPGSAHWAIKALHLLVGIGALGMAESLGVRMKRAGQ
jgi:hypothetical protein